MKCKECKLPKREKCRAPQGGGDQLGWTCYLLLESIRIDNSKLIYFDSISVPGYLRLYKGEV